MKEKVRKSQFKKPCIMTLQAHVGTGFIAIRTAEAETPTSLFQSLEVMVKELKDLQSPEGDLLLRKPGRSVLQGISSLRAACPLLCARRAGNGSDWGPGDLCLNQTVQYVPTQAPQPPSSKQRKEP
ncbi:hypothetical protein DPX16_15943 [Anabarilius grahami]|uniref:Uncharacterized protein n=1 Tax=Anabarilius grahami TaxID=495550 RepID=A0A3N0YTU1_ANAGA|nr:hypothetical protein DPX16_15943 [Anabarilius grahami]